MHAPTDSSFRLDRQSFIRAYVLDNVYVCVLMHILFYAALWYATTVSTIDPSSFTTRLPLCYLESLSHEILGHR